MLSHPTPFINATARTIPNVLCALLFVLATGSTAMAADFPLTSELRHGAENDYGFVHVEEDGAGGLIFHAEIDPEILGSRAHLRKLYFNLDNDVEGLELLTHDPVPRRYRLRSHGSSRHHDLFDVSVYFGRDRGRRSNGTLQEVNFSLVADGPLSVSDLLPLSFTRRGRALHMATHVMRAGHRRHGHTLFLGGVYEPEPEPDPEPEPEPDPDPDLEVPPGCELVIDLLTGEPRVVCR